MTTTLLMMAITGLGGCGAGGPAVGAGNSPGSATITVSPESGNFSMAAGSSTQDVQRNIDVRNTGSAPVNLVPSVDATWIQVASFQGTQIQPNEVRTCSVLLVGAQMQLLSAGGHTGHVYFTASGNTVGTYTVDLMVSRAQEQGWTQFTASQDTRIIYLSTSGNDSNDGLTEQSAKRTLNAGSAALRNGYPDWLLLKRGDSWIGEVFPFPFAKTGRSASEPMLVGAFGTGARPRIRTPNATVGMQSYGAAHLSVLSLDFSPNQYDGTSVSDGCWIYDANDVLMEDCRFQGYFVNVVVGASNNGRNTNIRFRRCQILDAYTTGSNHSQGFIAGETDALLIEECLFDHNGWSETVANAAPTMFRHNVYLQYDNGPVIFRRNICARGAADGVMQRSGGQQVYNLLLANPINGILQNRDATYQSLSQGNVAFESRNLDANSPRGWGFNIDNTDNMVVRDNICSHNTQGSQALPLYIDAVSDLAFIRNLQVINNIVYKWNGATQCSGSNQFVNVSLQGNMLQEPTLQQPVLRFTSVGSGSPVITSGNNMFSVAAPSNSWIAMPFGNTSLANYMTAVQDTSSQATAVSFPDPDRTIATYMVAQSLTGSIPEFLTNARNQSKSNWMPQWECITVVNYFRLGFGLSPVQ